MSQKKISEEEAMETSIENDLAQFKRFYMSIQDKTDIIRIFLVLLDNAYNPMPEYEHPEKAI